MGKWNKKEINSPLQACSKYKPKGKGTSLKYNLLYLKKFPNKQRKKDV